MYEGIQVVCAEDDVVVTAYRNRDFHGLRTAKFNHPRRDDGGLTKNTLGVSLL